MDEGSGLHGSDPSSTSADNEQMRQRIYRPDASPEDVAVYQRLLLAEQAAVETPPALQDPASEVTSPIALSDRPRRPRIIPIVTLSGVGLVIVVLIVLILIPRGAAPLPASLAPPHVLGLDLTDVGRAADPHATPTSITYQPAGYDVYQVAGQTIRVGLRCEGTGTVVVGAGQRFVFHCGVRRQVFEQVGKPATSPFVVIATTYGNVVWGARITAE